jgi:hypothetical protein
MGLWGIELWGIGLWGIAKSKISAPRKRMSRGWCTRCAAKTLNAVGSAAGHCGYQCTDFGDHLSARIVTVADFLELAKQSQQ